MSSVRPQAGKTFLVILASLAINIYGVQWIPIEVLKLPLFWRDIALRSITTLINLAILWKFSPRTLSVLFIRIEPFRLFVSLSIVTLLIGPSLFHTKYQGASLLQILEALLFALFIGLEEECFSRGLIFNLLKPFGLWTAAVFSSIIFGLLHLGNIIWGHQSASYTLAQAVSAGAFGFLAVGLTVYGGSIWVAIILHGLTDFPMQFDSEVQYSSTVNGQGDWVAVVLDIFIYLTLGILLINSSKTRFPR